MNIAASRPLPDMISLLHGSRPERFRDLIPPSCNASGTWAVSTATESDRALRSDAREKTHFMERLHFVEELPMKRYIAAVLSILGVAAGVGWKLSSHPETSLGLQDVGLDQHSERSRPSDAVARL